MKGIFITMKSAKIYTLTGILLAAGLVGCGSSKESTPADGIDTGVVVERSRRVVIVQEDDGERDKHSIGKRSRKCQVGERWPECKTRYSPAK